MALLLAPYNEAMRLGMGFNSYTQQLCVNDVVRNSDGSLASDNDLRAVPLKADGSKSSSGSQELTTRSEKDYLSQPSGSIERRVPGDGQKDVSQVVSWEAGFVDSISEVTSKLNISGALEITVDALGGGAGAKGEYVNNTSFKNADVKYDITVKVTNQKLVAANVTEFMPIPNVQPSQFTEVYGDCFISGFISGGVFHALVTKTLVDKSDLTKFGGGLSVKLALAGIDVKGSAEGGKTTQNDESRHETKISLNWSGGGDIKPDNVVEWDIPSLMRVAMEFPDNVAHCPQRTYAILTKYTSLRSYHEKTVKGSPLDYENAGIYTASLLDAYMDYKSLWRDIQQGLTDLEKGIVLMEPRSSPDYLADYSKLFQEDYTKRKERYDKALSLQGNGVTLEEPLPPNEVKPYIPTLFGLDKAKRDCRFEMIKIVREVSEVAFNPQVSVDPHRNWRFLAPSIFRRLIPGSKTVAGVKTEEELQKLREELKTALDNAINMEKNMGCARIENERVKEENQKAKEENQKAREENERLRQQVAATEEQERVNRDQTGKEHQERISKMEEDLRQRERELEVARTELNQEKEKSNGAARELEATKSELQKGQSTSTDISRELETVKGEMESLKAPYQLSDQTSDIVLYSIVWGNRQLLGWREMEDKVRMYVNGRWGFSIDNDFFGCDPIYGTAKSCSVVYKRRGESVKTVTGREGERSAFN